MSLSQVQFPLPHHHHHLIRVDMAILTLHLSHWEDLAQARDSLNTVIICNYIYNRIELLGQPYEVGSSTSPLFYVQKNGDVG